MEGHLTVRKQSHTDVEMKKREKQGIQHHASSKVANSLLSSSYALYSIVAIRLAKRPHMRKLDPFEKFGKLCYIYLTHCQRTGSLGMKNSVDIEINPEPPAPAGSWLKEMLVSIKDFIKDNTRFSNLVRIRIDRQMEAMKHNGKFKGQN